MVVWDAARSGDAESHSLNSFQRSVVGSLIFLVEVEPELLRASDRDRPCQRAITIGDDNVSKPIWQWQGFVSEHQLGDQSDLMARRILSGACAASRQGL